MVYQHSTHMRKIETLRNSINEYKLDILGLAEVNRNWYEIEDSHRWRQRTQHWWEAVHHSEAFNKHDVTSSAFQPGGVSLMSFNKTAHRVIERGEDPSGLGRWCYIVYRCKNGTNLRVISLYRCCKPSSPGPSTVYMQQKQYHDAKKDERDPRNSVLQDLNQQMEQWTMDNGKIVILADMNSNINSNMSTTWCSTYNLTEIITY